MKKVRESNFELLRCILMFMVVVLHYNTAGMGSAFTYVTPGSINYYILYFIESMVIVGTNGFVLLSGFFSWKSREVSFRKPVGLLLSVVVYNVLFYILNLVILKQPFSIMSLCFNFVPRNWFVSLFVMVMLLSPYLNMVIQMISEKSYKMLLAVMFVLFSVWSLVLDMAERLGVYTSGMSMIALNGAGDGYTLVNFIMLYFLGAGISRFGWFMHKRSLDILVYFSCTIVIFCLELFFGAGWSYANPFVIISGAAFFNIFRKLSITSKVINLFGKATLGVFLIHTQYLICDVGWKLFKVEEACQGSPLGQIINLFISCFVIYVGCTLFDILCVKLVSPVSKFIDTIPVLKRKLISTKMS